MPIIKLLLPVLFLLVPACSQASAGPEDCTSNDQCMVVEEACPNGWRAINKSHLSEHEKWLAETRPEIRCFAPDLGLAVPTQALCTAGKCEVVPPEKRPVVSSGPVDQARYCDRDVECIVAEDTCPGSWTAINSQSRELHQRRLDQSRPLIECMPPEGIKTAPDKAWCVNNQCIIQ